MQAPTSIHRRSRWKRAVILRTLAGTVAASKVKVDPSGVTSPVSLASLPTLAAGTNIVGKVGIDQTTPGTTNKVSIGTDGTIAVNTALPAGANAIGGVYQAPSASSSFAITPGSSSALESNHVLKGSAGNLYSLYVVTGSVGGYLMTFNATSAPVDGAVTPVECIPVPANSIGSLDFAVIPDNYSTGIVAVFSSTGPLTKTASATAFFKWRVQ